MRPWTTTRCMRWPMTGWSSSSQRAASETTGGCCPPNRWRRRSDHHLGVVPTAFASTHELARDELMAAPVHWPRPSRLAEPLVLTGGKARHAADVLGLHTVGDLLEHLPRDRREARTVSELVPGESATVVVEVRSISSRSVRRRGMRPIVEAMVGDGTGAIKATFFNQPWLAKAYPPGTRLVLHGRCQGRTRFGVQAHARTPEAPAGGTIGGEGAVGGAVAH